MWFRSVSEVRPTNQRKGNEMTKNIQTGTAPMTAAAQQFLESCGAVTEIREAGDHIEFDYDASVEVSYCPESLGIEW